MLKKASWALKLTPSILYLITKIVTVDSATLCHETSYKIYIYRGTISSLLLMNLSCLKCPHENVSLND